MGYGDRIRLATGWACVALVAAMISLGYHFGNVRFVPIAIGFGILAGVLLTMSRNQQVRSNAIHPAADTGIG